MGKSKVPYKLPKVLTCDEAETQSGINMEIVKKYIKKHKEMLPRYNYLESMYQGFHGIYDEKAKEDWKPDNRLAVNFPRYITDTFVGYGYGIPIKLTHEDKKVNEAIQIFCRQNEMTDHEAEMTKKCCIYGHAFEYLYQNEDAQTKVTALKPQEIFVVYDDKLSQKALFAIRYGVFPEGKKKGKLYGEILTRDKIISFEDEKILELEDNPYGYIPCIEWRLNDERLGLYEPVTGLIETYNKTIGEKANDVEAFAEAYLAVIGAEVDENGVHRIRDDRLINFYNTDNAKEVLVQFLTKPTADGTQENLLDRLETLIYQISMVANISDESFGSTTSGISLSYKLQAMSNLALMFDRKIEKSLRKRYKIFCSLKTNISDSEAYEDIEIKTTMNIPRNISEEVNVVAKLEGVVSKETQLSVLSIVTDAKAEIKKLEEEKASIQDEVLSASMFNAEDKISQLQESDLGGEPSQMNRQITG